MTKAFCDICGEPAGDIFREFVLALPDKTWTGTKSGPGSPNNTDGSYIPKFSVRTIFESSDVSQKNYAKTTPDLCVACMYKLCNGLLDELKASLPPL